MILFFVVVRHDLMSLDVKINDTYYHDIEIDIYMLNSLVKISRNRDKKIRPKTLHILKNPAPRSARKTRV